MYDGLPSPSAQADQRTGKSVVQMCALSTAGDARGTSALRLLRTVCGRSLGCRQLFRWAISALINVHHWAVSSAIILLPQHFYFHSRVRSFCKNRLAPQAHGNKNGLLSPVSVTQPRDAHGTHRYRQRLWFESISDAATEGISPLRSCPILRTKRSHCVVRDRSPSTQTLGYHPDHKRMDGSSLSHRNAPTAAGQRHLGQPVGRHQLAQGECLGSVRLETI